MDFLDEQMMNMAISHLLIGIWLPSNTVPTVTENCLRHEPQKYSPLRAGDLLAAFGVSGTTPLAALPVFSQCGQTGPLGQRSNSNNPRALSSSAYSCASEISVKSSCLSVLSIVFMLKHYQTICVCQVYYTGFACNQNW